MSTEIRKTKTKKKDNNRFEGSFLPYIIQKFWR